MFVERTLGLALVTESWSLVSRLAAQRHDRAADLPVQAVSRSGSTIRRRADRIESETYSVDALSQPAGSRRRRAPRRFQPARPLNAFEVAFTAGYGDEASDVPAPVRRL